jgi:hypothetical protein
LRPIFWVYFSPSMETEWFGSSWPKSNFVFSVSIFVFSDQKNIINVQTISVVKDMESEKNWKYGFTIERLSFHFIEEKVEEEFSDNQRYDAHGERLDKKS